MGLFEAERSAQQWGVHAAYWELLATSLRYPDEQLANVVLSGEWLAAAQEIANAAGLSVEGKLQQVCAEGGADAKAFAHLLRVEATRLFVSDIDAACSPYETVWRAADAGVEPLLFASRWAMDVQRFCRACGLGHPEGTNEPLDHVAAECELLESLSLRAVAGESDAALPGGSASAAYTQFAQEHAGTWMPRFAEKLCSETRVGFYRAVGALMRAAW